MEQYIQPLSDALKLNPELSAKIIVVISGIFTAMAGFYVYLQEQAKNVLREKGEVQKTRADVCEDEKRDMSTQIETVQQLVRSRTELAGELSKLSMELDKLKRKNFDLENLQNIQDNLDQLKTMIEGDIEDINQAIATQEDRRQIFKKAQKAQKKKVSTAFLRQKKD